MYFIILAIFVTTGLDSAKTHSNDKKEIDTMLF